MARSTRIGSGGGGGGGSGCVGVRAIETVLEGSISPSGAGLDLSSPTAADP